MISIENGKLCVQGTRLDLVSEFMCIVDSMLSKGIISEDFMLHLIILRCVPSDELKKMVIDYIDNMDDIGTALDLLYRL